MAAAQEYEPFMEEGLPPAAQPAPPRVRLAPRLALAAGLLALWGCAAALALRPRAPGVRVPGVQAPADVPLVSFAADGGFASDDLLEEEVNAPTEAIGRWEWDAEGATNCVSVVKGARYWVEDRRDSGWTYVRAFDYSEQGWAPDSALYHGEPTIVRKEYSANGFRVIPGDSVWVLDRKPNPSGGPDWCYVLFGDKEAWISEKAIHENDLIHPVACFVKEAYEAQDAAHLTIKKGEVVWANIADSTVPWVLVENDKKETGWVPRKHLIESRPLPVLQTFNADSKVDDSLPSPLLYVNEGDTVWVEDGQSQPGWIYSYIHNEEGYVPEWALMQVKVDGESEDQVSSKEEEGTTPGDEAPEEVEGGEGETPSEGKVEEATDAVSRSTPAPAEKKEEPAPEGNETVPAPAPAPVDDKEEPAPEGDEPVPAPAPAPDKDKEEPEDSDEPAPAPEPAPADDKEEPEDSDEPAPAPEPAPADDKEEPEDDDEPAPAPKPAPADDKEEPEDSDEPAPAPEPAPVGGLPAWLLGRALRENFNLRTGDQRYLHFVDRFWGELLPRVRPELLENGGALALLQLENEYGHWGDANQPSDRAYFEHLRSLVRRHLGPGVLLITTDDDEAVAKGRGGLPDVFAAVNFGPWEADARKHLDKVFANARLHNGEAPELVMELWSGWFQMWQHDENTKKQFKVAGKQLLDYVAALLERNASFTLYMAHGGTNFGLWPSAGFTMPEMGASFKWTSAFVSTSYDYAAPIAEDGRHGFGGDGVDKYAGLRSLLALHQSPDDPLPEEPAMPRFASYAGQGPSGEVLLRRRALLRDPAALAALRLGEAIALGGGPEAMELQGQQGGVALYRHRPADPDALRRAVARWHAEGSGRAPLLWPRVAVAVLAAAAGTTFMWRRLRCCRCCSVCVAIFVAVAFNVHDRWAKPDEAPLVLLARDRVTVWQGEALVLKPHLNIEHTCCPWQVRDLAVNVMPDGPGTLDVLVENLGRRAFMPRGYIGEGAGLRHIWYDWKGLVSARIGIEPLAGQWELHILPLADLHGLNGSAPPPSEPQVAAPAPQGSGPTFFEGQFVVPEDDAGPADSYLCLEAGPWSTGIAYVNGFNLGRYWRGAAAPLDLYVPKSALHQGWNVVVLLEMEPPATEEGAVLSLKAARG